MDFGSTTVYRSNTISTLYRQSGSIAQNYKVFTRHLVGSRSRNPLNSLQDLCPFHPGLRLFYLLPDAIRLALGYRASTPTNILLTESNLTSITERSKFLCISYLNKIYSNTDLLTKKATKFQFIALKKQSTTQIYYL